jgi:molybdenum cofactor biosynthesis protein A
MPEEGIQYLPKKDLLTFEEIITLVSLMASMGISKLRITGGEPFVRNDLMELLNSIVNIPGIREWHITTNGILTSPFIPELKKLGVSSVNLSLDTLDHTRFKLITRRDEFGACLNTLNNLIESQIPVKINAVVMAGKNIEDIIPLVLLTKEKNISVRFIEEMPFNGSGTTHKTWSYHQILNYLLKTFPDIQKIQDEENSTSYNYQIPGHRGSIGIIAAFSRTFCGTCNRIRLTAQGMLKTCLYDDGVLNIRDLIRSGATNDEIKLRLTSAFQSRAANGFEAEKKRQDRLSVHESMSTIGG